MVIGSDSKQEVGDLDGKEKGNTESLVVNALMKAHCNLLKV